jgi:hypothetical protein
MFPNDSIKLSNDTTQFYFSKNKDYPISLSCIDKDGICYSKSTKNIRVNCSVLSSNNYIKATQNSHIYPNPAINKLQITEIDTTTQYKIYSADLKLLKNGYYLEPVDISDLSPGIYLIEFNGNCSRFIKAN